MSIVLQALGVGSSSLKTSPPNQSTVGLTKKGATNAVALFVKIFVHAIHVTR